MSSTTTAPVSPVRPAPPEPPPTVIGAAFFAPTRWSIVLDARRTDSPESRRALEELCRIYWRPMRDYIRRRIDHPQDADDLAQDFFARLLEKQWLAAVAQEKGKFRAFLLVAVRNFLANKRDRERALKRGGGQRITHFDAHDEQSPLMREAAANHAPVAAIDQEFEREWALALLDRVLTRLQEEMAAAGKERLFAELKIYLTAGRGALPCAEAAQRLGTTEGAVKVAIHRLRGRYRQLLRDEIAHTVASREEVEEEIRALFAAFA